MHCKSLFWKKRKLKILHPIAHSALLILQYCWLMIKDKIVNVLVVSILQQMSTCLH